MSRYASEHLLFNDGSLGFIRAASREKDFGYTSDPGSYQRNYRVSYIDDTQELYVIDLSPGRHPVEILASGLTEDDADSLLDGWEFAPDINWFRERCKERKDGE